MSTELSLITRAAARVLLSGTFVVGGADAARHPETKVEQARIITAPLAEKLPLFPADTATVVRINGLAQVAAGVGLATGFLPRVAALVLAASLVPTTFVGHRFWERGEADGRFSELVQFLANAGLLGGLLLVAAAPQKRSGS